MRKSIFYLLTFTLLFTITGCSSEQAQSSKSGLLKQPSIEVKVYETGGNNPTVELPLFLWTSFDSKMINIYSHFTGGGKSEHCVLQESEGSQLQVGTKIEVLEEATCLYVRLNSVEGAPKNYSTGIMRIRIVETGEEGWTWSKAVEFDNQ